VTPAHPRRGVVERLAPAELGRDFRWLWVSTAATNLGDGILLAAGPLLIAALTRDPFAIALSVFLQQLPWLVFGLPAGAFVDRVDRRRLAVVVNWLRAIVLLALTLTVATETANVAVVLGAMFLLGTAETFADNAGQALVATRVPTSLLGLANARISGSRALTNQLAGPPIGGVLFGLGLWVPFGVEAICVALGAVLIGRLAPSAPRPERAEAPHLRREITDGMRWLWHHRALRVLALTVLFFNVTFGAAWGVFVLLAQERLGLDAFGFGLLMMVGAVGGLVGSTVYRRLELRFSLATLMRVGLAYETFTHLILATSTSALVVAATWTLFGIHEVVWGTIATTIRQRAVPASFLGRVTSVYMLAGVGGFAGGALLGGVLAQRFGVTAPYWFGFIGSTILLVLIWRTLDGIAHAPVAAEETEPVTTEVGSTTVRS
jgi:MFS family permease